MNPGLAYPQTSRPWETRPCAAPDCPEVLVTQHRAARYCSAACQKRAYYRRTADGEVRRLSGRESVSYAAAKAALAALAGEEQDRGAARDRVRSLWDTPLLTDADRASLAACADGLTNAVPFRRYGRMGPWGRADGFWTDERAAWRRRGTS